VLRAGMLRTLAAAEQIGIRAGLVESIDEEAAAFYRQYGFAEVFAESLELMMPRARDHGRVSGNGFDWPSADRVPIPASSPTAALSAPLRGLRADQRRADSLGTCS